MGNDMIKDHEEGEDDFFCSPKFTYPPPPPRSALN